MPQQPGPAAVCSTSSWRRALAATSWEPHAWRRVAVRAWARAETARSSVPANTSPPLAVGRERVWVGGDLKVWKQVGGYHPFPQVWFFCVDRCHTAARSNLPPVSDERGLPVISAHSATPRALPPPHMAARRSTRPPIPASSEAGDQTSAHVLDALSAMQAQMQNLGQIVLQLRAQQQSAQQMRAFASARQWCVHGVSRILAMTSTSEIRLAGRQRVLAQSICSKSAFTECVRVSCSYIVFG